MALWRPSEFNVFVIEEKKDHPPLPQKREEPLISQHLPSATVSLTSTLSKLYEKKLAHHLVCELEFHDHRHKKQFGFCLGRSTVDRIISLQSHHRGFAYCQHTLAIFLDMSKAFDTAWGHNTLHIPHTWNIEDRLLCCMTNFLGDRISKSEFSDHFHHTQNPIRSRRTGSDHTESSEMAKNWLRSCRTRPDHSEISQIARNPLRSHRTITDCAESAQVTQNHHGLCKTRSDHTELA